jgi:hypothetical protein
MISIVLFFLALQTTPLEPGVFRKDGRGFHYVLELKEDGQFFYFFDWGSIKSSCNGKWELQDNTLFLKCDPDPRPLAVIISGYISKRNFTMKVLSKNKLKVKKYRLTRQKKPHSLGDF